MSIPQKLKDEIIEKCKRRCCYCGTYCGEFIEIHHIIPKYDGGEDTADNLIPLCFNCHREIGRGYNNKHPKGIKYSERELKRRRDEIYSMVKNMPPMINISEKDKKLLEEFKSDYLNIITSVIYTDFSSRGTIIKTCFEDHIRRLNCKWYRNKDDFENIYLNNIKIDILCNFKKLYNIINPINYIYNENVDGLIIKDDKNIIEKIREETFLVREELQQLEGKLKSF